MKQFVVPEGKKVLNKTNLRTKQIHWWGDGEWAQDPIEIVNNGQSWKFWATK